MTNDEILLLVDTECPAREYVRIMSNPELIEFARAVAAKERQACVKIVDAEMEENAWESNASVVLNNVAAEIRARGE